MIFHMPKKPIKIQFLEKDPSKKLFCFLVDFVQFSLNWRESTFVSAVLTFSLFHLWMTWPIVIGGVTDTARLKMQVRLRGRVVFPPFLDRFLIRPSSQFSSSTAILRVALKLDFSCFLHPFQYTSVQLSEVIASS